MRPLMLKGHEGPLTAIKYNREGDLIFSCAKKDMKPCCWYTDNGERLGNYVGHEGAVWDLDVDFTSTKLLTASADRSMKLWEVETGKELFSFAHKSTVRTCAFAEGSKMVMSATENNFGEPSKVNIFNLENDISEQTDIPVREMISTESGKICKVLWGPLNHTVLSASEDGKIRRWNVETGEEESSVQAHGKEIRDMAYSKDKSMIITASVDKTARLFDARTLEHLKTYTSDRPLNSASISPLMNQVICGGGQDAMNVTVTSSKVGHFEVDFYHIVFQDFMGSVKGHFGPVNTVAFNPDGRSYSSGGEDGYVRMHHFDKDYFQTKEW